MEEVSFNFTKAVFVAVRNNQLDHKGLLMKETTKMPVPAWREEGRTRKHSDFKTPNSKKKSYENFIRINYFLLSPYTFLCSISKHVPP